MSGHQLTIAYDIYESNAVRQFIPSQLQAKLDVSSKPIYQFLQSKVMESRDFRPNGGRLAFPSNYEYSMPLIRQSAQLTDMLKGEHCFVNFPCRKVLIPLWEK